MADRPSPMFFTVSGPMHPQDIHAALDARMILLERYAIAVLADHDGALALAIQTVITDARQAGVAVAAWFAAECPELGRLAAETDQARRRIARQRRDLADLLIDASVVLEDRRNHGRDHQALVDRLIASAKGMSESARALDPTVGEDVSGR